MVGARRCCLAKTGAWRALLPLPFEEGLEYERKGREPVETEEVEWA